MRRLPRNQRQRHDPTDMHIRSVNVHVEVEFLTHSFDILQAFLEIGTCTADPDGGFVLDECGCEFPQSADDAFECGCDL